MPKVTQIPAEAKPQKIPVTFRVDDNELPEIKEWKVGGKYKLMMDVEQIESSKGEEYGPMEGKGKKMYGRFKVTSMKPMMDKMPVGRNDKMEYMKKMKGENHG